MISIKIDEEMWQMPPWKFSKSKRNTKKKENQEKEKKIIESLIETFFIVWNNIKKIQWGKERKKKNWWNGTICNQQYANSSFYILIYFSRKQKKKATDGCSISCALVAQSLVSTKKKWIHTPRLTN